MPKREANALERHDDHGDDRREHEAERRHDLRPAGPAEPERGPERPDEQRRERVATTQPRPVVAPVADVVDAAGRPGRRRRRCDPAIAARRHARTPGGRPRRSRRASAATSSRNRSSRECRPRSTPDQGQAQVRHRVADDVERRPAVERDPDRPVRRAGPVQDPQAAGREARRERVATLLHLDGQDPGLGGELGHRGRPEQAPAIDRHQVVADRLDLAQQVAGEDDRDPELGPGPPDEPEHLVATGRVEPVRRLVEEEEPGVVDDRLGQLDPLAHPGGVAADRPVALLGQPHVAEDVRRALAGGLGRQAGQLAGLGHELGGADVRREGRDARACSRRTAGAGSPASTGRSP